MNIADSFTKASQAVSNLSVVESYEDRPHLQMLAEALLELGALMATVLTVADLQALIKEQTEVLKETRQLMFELLTRLDKIEEASWR